MRLCSLVLLLILGRDVLAVPQVTRQHGAFSPGMVVPIRGKYFSGQVKFASEMDLRDCRQMRARMQLVNRSQKPACFAVYLTIQDARGNLLGAEGYQESVFLRGPGWEFDHQADLAMPKAEHSSAAHFQIVLVEDEKRLTE